MDTHEIISIDIGNLRVDEPIATLTDIIVAILCFIFFTKLVRQEKQNKSIKLFTYYFLLMGIATLFGGVLGHAFLYRLPDSMKLPGWIISMLSIMLIERAAINHAGILFPDKVINVLGKINILELLTFMGLSIYYLDFFYVEFHSGYGLMFVVLSLEGYLFLKTKNRASGLILIGIAFAALAALFFMNTWIIHPWFNHLAASHTLMAIAACFIYSGARIVDLKKVQQEHA
ncbi:hypothetical protein GYB22_01250 [bacterium]|nr:hypothetical protein [bacterium]